jgi:dGTPase
MMNWKQLLNPSRLGQRREEVLDLEEARSPFEADHGRILFSNPFRRLHNKTQVFPMPENDHVHSRLTHSLEVCNVGQTLGKMVGKVVIDRHGLQGHLLPEHFAQSVGTACLAHDIGNPPYGHYGEEAISSFFAKRFGAGDFQGVSQGDRADLERFEGNAQGFRILARLHMCKNEGGLRLTYGTLGAFLKYPQVGRWAGDKQRPGGKKFGAYLSEMELLQTVAESVGLLPVDGKEGAYQRHPLAYLMEAADDICYQVLDLEDGVALGLLSRRDFAELMQPMLKVDGSSWDVSRLRATVINGLIQEASSVFLDMEQDLLSGKGQGALMDLIPSAPHIDAVNDAAVRVCYKAPVVVKREVAASRIIDSLLTHLTDSAMGRHHRGLLETVLGEQFQPHAPLGYQLKSITDAVAAMTDRYALNLYRQLNGMDMAMA